MARQADKVFGARAIGYYCLATPELPDGAIEVADHLVDAAQYEMANELFEKLEGQLDHRRQLMWFRDPTTVGMMSQALQSRLDG